ncbi:hypothetical protein [Nocardioides sp.]|uniref:hypothetical protein n=1 Tax=Nocardioides sp. TaxID=35761 RepID=UPI003518FB06
MTENLDAARIGSLRAVAIDVAMPSGPGLDEAIRLAEELVADGLGGPATLDVASLPIGAAQRDAEPVVRAMLAEFDMEVPQAEGEAGRYRLLLWAFGHADLPVELFEGRFYARLAAWDEQAGRPSGHRARDEGSGPSGGSQGLANPHVRTTPRDGCISSCAGRSSNSSREVG